MDVVRRDANDPTHYWIVAGKYGDHGLHSEPPRPTPFGHEAFYPKVVN